MISAPTRRTGFFERPDCKIFYEITGSGPAIVFAHGLGGNHMSWWQQVGHFSKTHTCVAFAHRGFAPSSPLPAGPDPAAYADDLAALVAHLGLTDICLVAQSMGGWTSVEYALRRPPGLKALVLAATIGTVDPMRIREPELGRYTAWLETSKKTLAEYVANGIHPAGGARMLAEQPAMHLLYREIDDMNASIDKEALRTRLMHGRTRAPEELAAIACPILFIANDEDAVMPPMAPDAIAAVVPNARVAHIPDAGHSGYFERPAAFNRLVEDFLRAVG